MTVMGRLETLYGVRTRDRWRISSCRIGMASIVAASSGPLIGRSELSFAPPSLPTSTARKGLLADTQVSPKRLRLGRPSKGLDKDKIALLRAARQAFELALLLDHLGASRIGRKYDEHARFPSIVGERVAAGFRCIRRISHDAPNKNQKGPLLRFGAIGVA